MSGGSKKSPNHDMRRDYLIAIHLFGFLTADTRNLMQWCRDELIISALKRNY